MKLPTKKEKKDLERFVKWMNRNRIFGQHVTMIPVKIVDCYFEDGEQKRID